MNWLARLFGRRRDNSASQKLSKEEHLAQDAASPTSMEVDASQLKQLLSEREAFLLDCREPHEWVLGRIPGSLHIPMNFIPHRLAELPKTGLLVVVCAHGVRSLMVADFLKRQGFHAVSLNGGLARWHAEAGPIES